MATQHHDGLPEFLTVEEAARLIRVGRTKAYAMAKEWRATGGHAGLPVVDFGHVLRVPRRALERLIDDALTGVAAGGTKGDQPPSNGPASTPSPRVVEAAHRPHQAAPPANQLDLFEPPRAS